MPSVYRLKIKLLTKNPRAKEDGHEWSLSVFSTRLLRKGLSSGNKFCQ